MEDFSAIDLLVNNWITGSDMQFKPVFDHYYPQLLRYTVRFTKDETKSEELVMNVLFKVWQQKTRIAGLTDFNSYLFTMMRNEVISMTRKKQLQTQELDAENDHPAIAGDTLNYRELLQRYHQCLDKLPPRRRAAFILNREQGMSYAEIASELNVSVFTVQNHIASSLKSLRMALHDYTDFLPLLAACLLPMLTVY